MWTLARPYAAVLGGVLLFLLLQRLPVGGELAARAVADLGQLVAALVATVACIWRARRCAGPVCQVWRLMAAATGCWTAGEAVWSYYELLGRRETPFPSAADVGFLLFPVLAGIGLLLWPSAALRGGARWRTLLDGSLVAGSLFLLSFTTALGTALQNGSGGLLPYLVSVAYPAADLVLLTVTVVVVAQARDAAHSGLAVLATGLAALSVADSGFAYLTATGRYHTGSIVDAGWVAGFLLVALAAHSSCTEIEVPAETVGGVAPGATDTSLLPYLPAGVGLAAGLIAGLTGRASTVTLVAAALVVAALLGRQLLSLRDNQLLVREVLAAQQALHHQAFHDPLSGLANRALFTDRLRHGLELHRRDLRPLSLLYCDLDGFKHVNDTLGHDAGDFVIKAAAERLQAITRPGDTVARLGGDEFAVLLEDGGDAATVAGRILDGFARPVVIDSHSLSIGVSVGITYLDAAHPAVSASELLRRADSAMYASKRKGKGVATTWRPEAQPRTPTAVGSPAGP